MVDISNVATNINMIDNRLFSMPHWGSVYVIDETKKALIECGPTKSVPAVLEGIETIGLKPNDIDYVIVTHIHLDHAGGVGTLLTHLPNAQLVVHPKGAPHMINPEKLVAGAIAARGNEVIEMHGNVIPVDEDRVITVDDGEILTLGTRQTLTFLYTLGHAPHHMCIHESANNGVFTGDALAHYIADFDIIHPYHPPPQFDFAECLKTMDRIERLHAKKIYYSHFGAAENVKEHIERARKKLVAWDNIARDAAGQGTFDNVKSELISLGRSSLQPMTGISSSALLYDYLMNKNIPMSAEGHTAYYRKLLEIK